LSTSPQPGTVIATPAEEVVWSTAGGSGTRPPDRKIRPSRLRPVDAGVFLGAAAASLALVWLLYTQLAPTSGTLGFVLFWFAAFVLIYWICERELEGPLVAADKTVALVIGSVAVGLLIPLLTIIGFVVSKGVHALSTNFFTETLASVGPQSKATDGGGKHAIVGTLEQVGLAMLFCVPVGLATAVYMNEVGGRSVQIVRTMVNAMSGVPSIVAGLFIYAVWILQFHHTFSGFAASLALSILMLPTITRTAEEVLRLVPDGLREASLALGAPEWRTAWSIVLPTARSGLITAVILGVARAVGETAPLIMTAFGSNSMNTDAFKDPQQSLPLFVWQQYLAQLPGPLARAWTGALVLITMVLVLFTAARLIAGARSIAR
jgi:phosphate transport system permease protein